MPHPDHEETRVTPRDDKEQEEAPYRSAPTSWAEEPHAFKASPEFEDRCIVCYEPQAHARHKAASESVPSALSFDELRAANVLRCESAFHSVDAWTPWEWSNAMAGECGEACNVTKKMNRIWPANQFKQSWNKPEDSRMADLEQKLADELADVVIYADLLAARIGRSLAECVRHKFNEKSDEIGSPVKIAALASASGKAEAT